MPNQLVQAKSAYLLQHAENPIHWIEFEDNPGDRPLFISVGYASCHWCHVMAHEAFENEGVARVLNEHFRSIKIDREERPDLDDYYMAAVQLASGRGGWPISVFALPDGRPFFAGTYFPVDDRPPQPGILSICISIARTWNEDRNRINEAADELDEAIRDVLERRLPAERPLDRALTMHVVAALSSEFDPMHGGFGDAPKFPPYTAIEFLLETGEEQAAAMALQTLVTIERGGIHDHVGGGYHRYSTDAAWHLPHFEKMLYDNALLLGNFARAGLRDEANDILTFLDRDFLTPSGLFGASWDADSEGEEGKYYTWTTSQVRNVLEDRAQPFIDAYALSEEGNFRDEATRQRTGHNVLHRQSTDRFLPELTALFEQRRRRIPPSFDPKPIVGWNALILPGLVTLGEHERAQGLAQRLTEPKPLRRLIDSDEPAHLEDYAAVLYGLSCLDPHHPDLDRLWNEVMRFYDPFSATFRTAPLGSIIPGQCPVYDTPIPSANSLLARAAIRTGRRPLARSLLSRLSGQIYEAPTATEGLATAALELTRLPPAGVFECWIPIGYKLDPQQISVEAPEGWDWTLDGNRITFSGANPHEGLVVVGYAVCNDSLCLPLRVEREKISPAMH